MNASWKGTVLMEARAYGYHSAGRCMHVCDSVSVPIWPRGVTLSLQLHCAQCNCNSQCNWETILMSVMTLSIRTYNTIWHLKKNKQTGKTGLKETKPNVKLNDAAQNFSTFIRHWQMMLAVCLLKSSYCIDLQVDLLYDFNHAHSF